MEGKLADRRGKRANKALRIHGQDRLNNEDLNIMEDQRKARKDETNKAERCERVYEQKNQRARGGH